MAFLIELGGLAGNAFEAFMEAGEIIKPGFKADLFDVRLIVQDQFTGIAYPDFREKLRKGLACPGLEIPAKGIGHKVCHTCNLLQLDLFSEVVEREVVNIVHPFVFRLAEIGFEAYRGKLDDLRQCGDVHQAFQQSNDLMKAVRLVDLFYFQCDISGVLLLDQDPPFCFLQNGFNRLGLRKCQKTLAHKIVKEMDDGGIGIIRVFIGKAGGVVLPVMRQATAHQYNIAGRKPFDVVADKLCACTFVKTDQFDLCMVMPPVVDIGDHVLSYTERMIGRVGDFKVLRLHL